MSQHKEQSGLDIRTVWSKTGYYVLAYTVDRTRQILFSLDNYNEEAWHTLLEAAGERLDELFNPGPEPADKVAPGKAVEIYMLLPWAGLSKKIIKEFYEMVNSRVVFRIKNQAHFPLEDPPLVHGSEFLIWGAPNPMILVGAKPLKLSLAAFYEWPQ